MLKVIFYSSFGFAIFASFFSLLFYFGDWQRLGFVLGLLIGLVAAPEFESKAKIWKIWDIHQILVQKQ